MVSIISSFFQDTKFTVVALLIVVDIVLGVGAAVFNKDQSFGLHFVANFLRNDVLGKVFPWFVLYAADKASHNATVTLGVDLNTVATAAFVAVTAALIGSLTTSLSDFNVPMPAALSRKSG